LRGLGRWSWCLVDVIDRFRRFDVSVDEELKREPVRR